jgi:hypothetical protein
VPKGPLTRFFFLNTRWLGVYLHRIDRADADRELHDHPWSFVSLVLRGWYYERLRERDGRHRYIERRRFSLAYRHFIAVHRIALVAPNTWTLVIRGYDRRTWGFYQQAGEWCRWIEWRRFDALRSSR